MANFLQNFFDDAVEDIFNSDQPSNEIRNAPAVADGQAMRMKIVEVQSDPSNWNEDKFNSKGIAALNRIANSFFVSPRTLRGRE